VYEIAQGGQVAGCCEHGNEWEFSSLVGCATSFSRSVLLYGES
jgi:hypothetical protein